MTGGASGGSAREYGRLIGCPEQHHDLPVQLKRAVTFYERKARAAWHRVLGIRARDSATNHVFDNSIN